MSNIDLTNLIKEATSSTDDQKNDRKYIKTYYFPRLTLYSDKRPETNKSPSLVFGII